MLTNRFRSWAGAKSSTLALMFTDVVGSTTLGRDLGDELMFQVREAHFGAARSAISKFGGYEIKTIGDSFMAAFRTASAALNCAIEIHRNPGDPRLAIRAGIHVGPVRIAEDDAWGTMVNYAARVVGAVKDPQIWISDRAYNDVRLEGLAAHRKLAWKEQRREFLKGFDGPQLLWQVVI